MTDNVNEDQCSEYRKTIYDRMHDNWKTLVVTVVLATLTAVGTSVGVAGCSIKTQTEVRERLTRVETAQGFMLKAVEQIGRDVKHIKENGTNGK